MSDHEKKYLYNEQRNERFVAAIQELQGFIQKLRILKSSNIELEYVNDKIEKAIRTAGEKELSHRNKLYKLEPGHLDYYFHAWLAAQYSEFAVVIKRILSDFPKIGSTRLYTFNAWTGEMIRDLNNLIAQRRAKWPRSN